MGPTRVTEAPFVVLSDGVVTLRCLQLADAAAHLAGEDDEQVRWLTEGQRSVPDRLPGWIESNQREWLTGGPRRHLGIRDAASDVLIGNVEANLALPGLGPGEANISYAVFPDWRGRGVGARAVRLVCEWLAEATDCTAAVVRVAPDNARSHAVAVAAGFTCARTMTTPDGEVLVRYVRSLRDDL